MFFSSCISPCNEICKYTQLQLSTVKVMWSQYIKLQKFYSCQCECPWSRPGILLCFSWCPASMSKYDTVSVLLFSLLPTILSHVPWTEHKAEISTAGGEALWIYLLMSSLLRLREAPYIPKKPWAAAPLRCTFCAEFNSCTAYWNCSSFLFSSLTRTEEYPSQTRKLAAKFQAHHFEQRSSKFLHKTFAN